MVVSVALASALCYAVAMVLQQHSAGEAAAGWERRAGPGLVADLARRPLWVSGVAANGVAYALRYVALGRGSLVLVEPMLVSSLLFALPASARWHRYRLRPGEWAGAACVAVGLALFLVAARPTNGRSAASGAAWLAAAALVGAAALVAVLAARNRTGAARARLLAAAGAVLFALMAALTKATAAGSHNHLIPSLTHWPPYALVATALVAVVVVQSAFAAGPLPASLPVLMVLEPVTGVVLGATLFGEHLAGLVASRAAEAAGLALMAVGVAVVARSQAMAAA